jgi:hypothetical protein
VFILSQIGNTYNIPVRFWILDSHPFAPPICFLKPTANMGISVGKHVDAQGRIYLPYLQNWSHVRSACIFFKKFLFDSDGTKYKHTALSFNYSLHVIFRSNLQFSSLGWFKSQSPHDNSLYKASVSWSGSQLVFVPCLFITACHLRKHMKSY